MDINRRDALKVISAMSLTGGISSTMAQQQTTESDGGLMRSAEYATPRTWEELKAEVQARTDRQVYPMTGMLSDDVRVILSRIHSLDRDEWGREWSAMARQWIKRGDELKSKDRKEAGEAYIMAWRYASFGGWPIAISPEKQSAYNLSLDAFGKYGALQDSPIEKVEIPVQGSSVSIYIQLPKSRSPVPVVVSIGGLDSYKEYVAERYGPVYMQHGVGYVAVDAPNTGEARVPADEHGEQIYSAVIDWLLTRKDIDPKRIGVQGTSLGGYWSTKVAFTEARRLKLAVNWAGPLDVSWSSQQLMRALKSREYLFDLPQALMTVWGYSTPEALITGQPKMSIVKQGLMSKPTPPMLVVNGLKDTLVPAPDTLLLLQSGQPKSAWLNPEGIHLGRTADWNDERIMLEVIMPWVLSTFKA